MKKIFISQPMNGKTDEFILAERNKAIKAAKDYFVDDVVVLAKDWKNYRGCKIEHICAVEYGIDVIAL